MGATAAGEAVSRFYLALDAVRGSAPSPALGVYLNIPDGDAPDGHPELLAGGVTMFGLSVASDPNGEHGGAGLGYTLDITDLDATAAFVRGAGPFDILLNSAGMARHSPALDTTPEDYDAAMALNLRAAYFLTREVARGLIAAGKPGSLINVSSQMGHIAAHDRAVYAANKHALEGMTKAMALEWGPHGIRVNTLCPTFIRTPLAEQTLKDPAKRDWVLSRIALGRLGEVEDLMGPVVFLASDASALMTGTHLLIDGGWTAE
jgi:NAD(P)-dependent dehydrogenase (short-subunit alcohol dehydrogenase family)